MRNCWPPPVDGSESTSQVLKELYPRESGAQIALPGIGVEWDAELVEVKRQIKTLETRKAELENQFKAALKEATEGLLPNGVVYTWKTTRRAGHCSSDLVSGTEACRAKPDAVGQDCVTVMNGEVQPRGFGRAESKEDCYGEVD
jgi:hypothetical protein